MTSSRPVGAADPDEDPDEGPLRRRLRVPMFTATTVGLGVIAHVAAGGRLPGAALVLLIVAAVTVTSGSLRRRERGLPSIVLAVGLVQVGIHVALLTGHEHLKTAAAGTPLVMLMTHLCAVMALAWWLRRGEIAAWRAGVTLWRRHVRLPSIPGWSTPSLRALPAPPCRAGFTRALAVVIPVRGPPSPTRSTRYATSLPAIP